MIVIDKIEVARDPQRIMGSIDAPREGQVVDGVDLNLAGWILGNGSVIRKVHIYEGQNYLYQLRLSVERPDVLAAYAWAPDVPRTRPGFEATVNALDFPARFQLRIVLILDSGETIEFAMVSAYRQPLERDQSLPPYSEYRTYRIIELVQTILQDSSLSLYHDLWSKNDFVITPDYQALNRLKLVNPQVQFSDVPLPQQLARLKSQETQSQEAAAHELIDLVRPLLGTGQYHSYFNLWASAGFHILPVVPEPEITTFLPNLFILGAAKCGTTTLHAYLSNIPTVCMSNPKEPLFFELEYELGLNFYHRRYFAHWRGEPIIGEARHRNLYLPFVPERIFALNPQAKLVVCVRNPIERCYSNWWHAYSRRLERLGFEPAVNEDMDRIRAGRNTTSLLERSLYRFSFDVGINAIYRTYLDSGYYYEQITRYLQYFPKDQLKIILFEDLVQNPYLVIRDLEAFIGSDYYTPDTFMPKHENKRLSETSHLKRQEISPQFRELLREHFRDHNARLADLIGRDLSHWQ